MRDQPGWAGKKGEPVGKVAKRKLVRLKQIVGNREIWREKIEQLKRMRQWVLEASHILDGSWAEVPEQSDGSEHSAAKKRLTNKEVGLRFDAFLQDVSQEITKEGMSQTERECLEEFLRVLHNLRPSLIQCDDVEDFPRTNNEMEGAIRKVKTRYRRISGRKNWNIYSTRVRDAMWHFMSGGMPIQSDGINLRDWRRTSIENIGSK